MNDKLKFTTQQKVNRNDKKKKKNDTKNNKFLPFQPLQGPSTQSTKHKSAGNAMVRGDNDNCSF
jgi:hypothetical protein